MGGTAPPLPLSPLAALGGGGCPPSGHMASLPSPLPSMCPSSSCIVCAPVVTGRSSGVAGCAAPFTTPCRAWWLGHSAPAVFYLPSVCAAQPHSTRPAVKTPACTAYLLVCVSCAVLHAPPHGALTAAGGRLFAVPASQTARVAGLPLACRRPLFAPDTPARHASPARLARRAVGVVPVAPHTIHTASSYAGSLWLPAPPYAAACITRSACVASGRGGCRPPFAARAGLYS